MRHWPRVTVQLPIFNEYYVIERLLTAVAALDYPSERLEIQVLDDSTDDTAELAARMVRNLQSEGLDIVHLRRTNRSGYKAGALEAGLARARGEYLCIFDADFVPPVDFLRYTLPHFEETDVGMVQVRWGHLNRDQSILTRIQAMFLDAHFAVEQAARNWSGRFFNFNGTAGIWRRAAIEEAGGWQHDTLTEDIDLSYRSQLLGWRFVYLADPVAPAELPASLNGFRSQQHRWTRGAVQTALKLASAIRHAGVPIGVKVEAAFHLLANLTYPMMVALAVLIFPSALVRAGHEASWLQALDLVILVCAMGSVCTFFVVAQSQVGSSWYRAVFLLPALMMLGIGISLSNSVAVLQGLRNDPGEFIRTPKLALRHACHSSGMMRYQARGTMLPLVELAIGFYFSVAVAIAVQLGLWSALPFLILFQAGYLYVGTLSLGELVQNRRRAYAT